MESLTKPYSLFGGDKDWASSDWTASDDRVRGGKSQSYLECKDKIGRFYGTLDIKTLGGAGFASQRTTSEGDWDLSDYAGIQISVKEGDKKRYTLTLKDEVLPNRDDGREQSSISYECDFELPSQAQPGHIHDRVITIPWKSFNATYRGRLKEDAKAINLKKIMRFSIMMRSFFGTQEGDFSLSIKSITAVSKIPKEASIYALNDLGGLEKGRLEAASSTGASPNGSSVPRTNVRFDRRTTTIVAAVLSLMAVTFLWQSSSAWCHDRMSGK